MKENFRRRTFKFQNKIRLAENEKVSFKLKLKNQEKASGWGLA